MTYPMEDILEMVSSIKVYQSEPDMVYFVEVTPLLSRCPVPKLEPFVKSGPDLDNVFLSVLSQLKGW